MDVLYEACYLSCERWINSIEQNNIENHTFSKQHQKAMHDICNKLKYPYLRKNIIIAIIAALITLLITTSIFAVVHYKEHIIKQFDTYSIYSVFPNTQTEDIKSFDISYIPDGFSKKDENISKSSHHILYANDNYYFNAEKHKLGTDINFDTEEYNYREFEIDGTKYIFYSSAEDITGVIWNNGKYEFLVYGNISEDEFLKIIMSIN